LENIDIITVYNSDYYDEGDTPTANPEIQNQETYYIYEIHDATYYETLSYVSALLLTSSNLPATGTYSNAQVSLSYKLINNKSEVDNSIKSLLKLNIDHSREQLTRLIYSNTSILTNSILLNKNTSIQFINLKLFYIDKYMNIHELRLHKYDSINICLTLNY